MFFAAVHESVHGTFETCRDVRVESAFRGKPDLTIAVADFRFGPRLCENLTDAMIPFLNRGGMMKGFVQGADRQQTTLLPECLDDWVDESNPVRAVDVFVDALELRDLGFDGVTPAATGRPGYHPSSMLKLYIYGYLNRVQSSRRLEREAGRNLEVMWLTGRLVPDHKTIADFRKDNGPAIKKVCAQFVALCRKMGLLAKASVAIDGSKFKAVNSRDNNFTKGKMERRLAQIEESVARYLSQLDTADRQTAAGEAPSEELVARTARLKEKLIKLEEEVKRLKAIEKVMLAAPDQQVSFTDSDSRSMATSGRGSGMVGYNVQAAVDTTNHLIVAHEVTNVGTDKSHLANMANQAKAALEAENLEAFADRGYFKGEEILACDEAGITVTLPKPQTSEAKSEGRFGKQDFRYVAEADIYICPTGEKLTHHFTNEENGLVLHHYWTNACRTCALKAQCTKGPQRRIKRWEDEYVVDAVQARLDRNPDAMRTRRETVEHPFGTLKMRMGATHFLMKTLPKVATEMALHVLAYNLTRVMNIVGIKPFLAAIRA
jgi:transposase